MVIAGRHPAASSAVTTARNSNADKRLELQIAQLEQKADEPGHQAAGASQDSTSGRGDTVRQLAELRRQYADRAAAQTGGLRCPC